MSNDGLGPTPRERLMATLGGADTDRPPCICPGGMMNMVTRDLMDAAGVFLPAAHSDAAQMARLARASYEAGCFENYGVPFCMTVEAEALGAQVDLGSPTCEPHVYGYAIAAAREWPSLRRMDLGGGRPRTVLDALRILSADGDSSVPVVGNLVGPVSTAGSVLDPAVLYREMRKDRPSVHGLLAFVTEQLVDFGRAQVEAGADVVAVADPSGTGEILGPRLFEEYTLRYLNELVDALHCCGARVIVHICGQMHSVYGQLRKMRANALSFDALVTLSRAREQLPGRILMGNVSTYAIEHSTPATVARSARRCAHNGARIVAPACGLSMTSPLENVRAMRDGLSGERRRGEDEEDAEGAEGTEDAGGASCRR